MYHHRKLQPGSIVNTVVYPFCILHLRPGDALLWDTFEEAVPTKPFGLEPMPVGHSQAIYTTLTQNRQTLVGNTSMAVASGFSSRNVSSGT